MKVWFACNAEFDNTHNFCSLCGSKLTDTYNCCQDASRKQIPIENYYNQNRLHREENFIRRRIMTLRQEGLKLPDDDFKMIQDLLNVRRSGLTAEDMFTEADMLEDSNDIEGARNWFLLAMLEGHPDAKRRYKEVTSSTIQVLKKCLLFIIKLTRL